MKNKIANNKLDRRNARELIHSCIKYYDYKRLQQQLNELTPVEFRMLASA